MLWLTTSTSCWMWVREISSHHFLQPSAEFLEKENQDDESLYKFRAITAHHGPLEKDDPTYNGSLYNVIIE